MNERPVFRFAPSPNGELHLGHAYSALLNLKMARAIDGKILLRIEDIDTERCKPELEKQMLEDLEWIGFEWDEPPRRQSEHFNDYRDALLKLESLRLVYASSMSRSDIKKRIEELEEPGIPWPRDPDGAPLYPGTERDEMASERKPVASLLGYQIIRLDVARALGQTSSQFTWHEIISVGGNIITQITAQPDEWGDIILARRDTPTSYHLSCVTDDALQGVTNIVRGKDLYQSTSVQRLLQQLLDLPEPVYHHHDLILDEAGKKLSKSNQETSLRQLREAGLNKTQIIEMIGLD